MAAVLFAGFSSEAEAGKSRHLGYSEVKGVELPTPPTDAALVVFLRPHRGGGSVHAAVYDGESFLTFVQNDTCFIYSTEPGQHRFMVVSEAADFLDADLEAGKLYFIQVKPRMGGWRARFSLYAITAETEEWQKLEQWLAKAVVAEPKESAHGWARDNNESVMTKKAAYLPKWLSKPEAKRPELKKSDGVTGL